MTAYPSSRPARAAGVVVAVALLAGCGGATGTVDAASSAGAPSTADGQPTASATASSKPAPSSSATASSTPSGTAASGTAPADDRPADTSPDIAEAVHPAGLTVTAVRAARQEGHDRVVFELAGSGTPGWRVEYVDGPVAQGSGDPVDVPGAAALQVTLQGVSYPYETGAEEVPRGAVPVSGTEHVAGVVYDATFEGTAVAWIGTDATAPFRVYSLTGPSRVVVEVVDAG
ncbi:hypothetical protein GCU67_04335 [Modestobacter muralis]|uniref:AMIN-like domain-containing protein n=1 Tax=Modestobacter muralis TaxID=1608614 RepID=A0A6P0EQM2_9ACTN|nr:hypothetical protein [Modestobacter muralis]NEK93407.1 hypothetical protein [Modestobacter muralis]NEN50174.1 hypothetical protein [Modestobacter muralis]